MTPKILRAYNQARVSLRAQMAPAAEPDEVPDCPLVVLAPDRSSATVYLYDVIDPYADEFWGGISAHQLVPQLAQLSDVPLIHVRINSPGGDVFDARSMATTLRQLPGRTVAHIDGMAASAVTTIAASCNTVEIAPGAMMMIHKAGCGMWGNSDDLRQMAELLDMIDVCISGDYVRRAKAAGKTTTADDWIAAMAKTTWYTDQAAIDAGLADSIAADAAAPTDPAAGPSARGTATPTALAAAWRPVVDAMLAERRDLKNLAPPPAPTPAPALPDRIKQLLAEAAAVDAAYARARCVAALLARH